jgi:hypothetical protein
MGYWSIMSSVDDIRGETYRTSLDPEAALARLESALPQPGRVECRRTPEGGLTARTLHHTPAWAFIGLIWLVLIRKNRETTIVATATPTGSDLLVNGRLDHLAAQQIRALPA